MLLAGHFYTDALITQADRLARATRTTLNNLMETHEAAPHTRYIARKGEINAWDNSDFVEAIKATGKNN